MKTNIHSLTSELQIKTIFIYCNAFCYFILTSFYVLVENKNFIYSNFKGPNINIVLTHVFDNFKQENLAKFLC